LGYCLLLELPKYNVANAVDALSIVCRVYQSIFRSIYYLQTWS